MHRRVRSVYLLAVVASLAAGPLLAGCGDDDDDDPAPSASTPVAGGARAVKVNIASFKFLPKDIKVRKGGTVTWVNRDVAPHTATDENKANRARFNTDTLKTREAGPVTFAKPGKYQYFCIFHPFMVGTVTVTES